MLSFFNNSMFLGVTSTCNSVSANGLYFFLHRRIEKRLMSGLPNQALTEVKYIIAHESGNGNNTGPNALENEIAYMSRNRPS